MLTTKRIAVLMGGLSAEREISLRSGRAVWAALIRKGYDAIPLEVDASVVARLREVRAQIAFIALHGPGGEDGTIQGMLEVLRMPYTGSGVQACAVAMDKAMTKRLLEHGRLPVPRGFVRILRERRRPLPSGYKFPLVIKPVNIDGRELTVAILNDRPLPIVEIIPKSGFYDFAAKYTPGASHYQVPAKLSNRLTEQLQVLALDMHRRLGCRGATRVDFRLDKRGRPFILELNTVPGMTETSLLPMAAKAARLSYEDMVEAILTSALQREAEWAPSRGRA